MSVVLAVNCGFGSSAGLFEDGRAVLCMEEERLGRVKNWIGLPEKVLGHLVSSGQADPSRVDAVVLANDRYFHSSRELFYSLYDRNFEEAGKALPLGRYKGAFWKLADPLLDRLGERGMLPDRAEDEAFLEGLGFSRSVMHRANHHFCHAAAAYHGLAPDDGDVLVFTLDGGGDGLKAAVYRGRGGSLERLLAFDGFSVGNVYSAVTYLLGFTPHEHEYKLMGLAPYVDPRHAGRYREFFAQFVGLTDGDTRFTNPAGLDYQRFYKAALPGLRRARFDNVAAGLQAFAEDVVLRWVVGNVRAHGVRRVLLSGGVFMNVKLNMLIAAHPEIEFADVFPSCGDESNIFGAAFADHAARGGRATGLLDRYTLGTSPEQDAAAAIEAVGGKVRTRHLADPQSFIVQELLAGRIVARCSGPMEFGARALGNRSILANPADLRTVGRINRAIKNRDFWMPFAPVVLWDRAQELLRVPDSLHPHGSPYMMFAFETTDAAREAMPCGLHQADFTARAQTVTEGRYPELAAIIGGFAEKTGVSALLNTSFNLHGFPIVENAAQALDVLLGSAIDVLVLGDTAVTRREA